MSNIDNINIAKSFDIKKINKTQNIHFIGLGGIGMSGLAKFLLELGYKVSGSDIKDSPNMLSIAGNGGTVYIGHNAENINNSALIVVSSAINVENPEIIEAIKRNIPIVRRSQVLEALMDGLGLENDKKHVSIGVSGTHGKTTTTGMTSLVFEDTGLNPSIVVGGQLPYLNTNSKLGSGDYFIAELDESDGSIELYSPNISIITNLETDHLDHYTKGFDQLLDTFCDYINNLDKDAKIIINTDCPGNRQLIEKTNHNGFIRYSIEDNEAEFKAKNIILKGTNTFADIYRDNEFIGKLELSIPGVHNISNALAVIAVGLLNSLSFNEIVKSLKRFTGMKRRFQVLGEACGAKIIDDYAHHPTEIKATLKSAKSVIDENKKGRVVAIFQPHRYTRLKDFWNEFLQSFDDADVLFVCDVYAASEKPIENINTNNFIKEINHKNVKYLEGPIELLANNLINEIKEDDIVLTIGAGDITKLGHIIIEKKGAYKPLRVN